MRQRIVFFPGYLLVSPSLLLLILKLSVDTHKKADVRVVALFFSSDEAQSYTSKHTAKLVEYFESIFVLVTKEIVRGALHALQFLQ
jgi:hypothetical protein